MGGRQEFVWFHRFRSGWHFCAVSIVYINVCATFTCTRQQASLSMLKAFRSHYFAVSQTVNGVSTFRHCSIASNGLDRL